MSEQKIETNKENTAASSELETKEQTSTVAVKEKESEHTLLNRMFSDPFFNMPSLMNRSFNSILSDFNREMRQFEEWRNEMWSSVSKMIKDKAENPDEHTHITVNTYSNKPSFGLSKSAIDELYEFSKNDKVLFELNLKKNGVTYIIEGNEVHVLNDEKNKTTYAFT